MDRNLLKSWGNLNRKRIRVMSIETIKHKVRCSTIQNLKRLDIKIKTKSRKWHSGSKIQEHATKMNLQISTDRSKIMCTTKSYITDLEMGKSAKKD